MVRVVVTFVPAHLAVVGDKQGAAALEFDRPLELLENFWDNVILAFLRVLDCYSIVVLQHHDCIAAGPDAKHGAVDYVCEGALRIESNSFSNRCRIIAASHEPSLATRKADEISNSKDLISNPSLPSLMSGEGCEVSRLKLLDDANGEMVHKSEGWRLASVIGSVSDLLDGVSVSVMAIVRPLCDNFIAFKVASPSQVRPA